jgi:D-alanyl-lipoteichoic acid acyltransferase DltB (MBOAT superfamily)
MVLGYVKKLVFADTLAPLVEASLARPDEVGGITTLAGILAFAVQIYGDFAGYSLIARGLGRVMGVHLMENFKRPYLALDPRDFWRRWHISLSSWLRSYLYIPLGGSRLGKARTCVNLMITMLLGGLWHGSSWTFVLWGGYHGALLVLCHLFDPQGCPEGASLLRKAARVAGTFILTLFGWLLFRAQDLAHLRALLANLLWNFRWTPETPYFLVPAVTLFALLMAYHLWQAAARNPLVLRTVNPWARRWAYATLLLAALAVGARQSPFIYFQF